MIDGNGYDVPINEVAKMLDKSDRQVRRYVKERRLRARPIRIEGHVRLMFNRDEVAAFRDAAVRPEAGATQDAPLYVDAQLIDDVEDLDPPISEATILDGPDNGDSGAVKYVIDVLKEQIDNLRKENQDLHYQLEQRSGLVGFWQGKAEVLQEEVKALAPVPKPDEPSAQPARSWWQKFWGLG